MSYNLPQNPDAPDGKMYMRATVDAAQQLINASKTNGNDFYNSNREQIFRAMRIMGNANAINIADYARDAYTGAYDDEKHVNARAERKQALKEIYDNFKSSNPETKFSGNVNSFEDIE